MIRLYILGREIKQEVIYKSPLLKEKHDDSENINLIEK